MIEILNLTPKDLVPALNKVFDLAGEKISNLNTFHRPLFQIEVVTAHVKAAT